MNLNRQRGIAQLVVIAVMAFLVLGLPLTTKLVQKSQENRSNAATNCKCSKSAYSDTLNCSRNGGKWTCGSTIPTRVPTKKPIPTIVPTKKPTPILVPTKKPTPILVPTKKPTPILVPTKKPTPTKVPTRKPTPTLVSSCIDRQMKCVGNISQYCNKGKWELETCEFGCNDETKWCNMDCRPGIKKCVDGENGILDQCNSLGEYEEVAEPCPKGCNGLTNNCNSICRANYDTKCNVNNLQRCNPSGDGYTNYGICEYGCRIDSADGRAKCNMCKEYGYHVTKCIDDNTTVVCMTDNPSNIKAYLYWDYDLPQPCSQGCNRQFQKCNEDL